jgi:hypothetical protein
MSHSQFATDEAILYLQGLSSPERSRGEPRGEVQLGDELQAAHELRAAHELQVPHEPRAVHELRAAHEPPCSQLCELQPPYFRPPCSQLYE